MGWDAISEVLTNCLCLCEGVSCNDVLLESSAIGRLVLFDCSDIITQPGRPECLQSLGEVGVSPCEWSEVAQTFCVTCLTNNNNNKSLWEAHYLLHCSHAFCFL